MLRPKKHNKLNIIIFFSFGFLLISLATIAGPIARGQVTDPKASDYGLNDPSFKQIALGQTSDLKGTVAQIINIILGVLGIVAVLIILFAGFKWMTAAGNEEQVRSARQMLIQAISGLVIVFAAWVIASFVINSLKDATDAGGGGSSASQIVSTPIINSPPSSAPGSGEPGGLSKLSSGDISLPNDNASNANPDSDSDGLTDTEELNVYHTNPNNSDTDGDGHPDGTEAQNGYSPTGDGKIVDPQNSESCGSLVSLFASALGNSSKLADLQKQIEDCCAQKQNPLCSGL